MGGRGPERRAQGLGGGSAGSPKTEPGGASGDEPRVWLQDQGRWGVGDYDEASGLYESYEDPQLTIGRLLTDHWDLVDADLHEIYGLDSEDPVVLDERTWGWFKRRLIGLLSCECRIQRKLAPPEKTKPQKTPHIPRRRR